MPAGKSASRPFQIHYEFVLSDNIPTSDAKYLQARLFPATNAVLRRYIQIRRPVPNGILRLTPTCKDGWKVCTEAPNNCHTACANWGDMTCADFPIPSQHLDALHTCNTSHNNCTSTPPGQGVDADVIIYVTDQLSDSQCNGTLAQALPCAYDTATNRPVAGIIKLCQFGPGRFQEDLAATVHELIHILGMSTRFWNVSDAAPAMTRYVDSDLAPIPASRVFEAFEPGDNRTRYRIITPSVRSAARQHFACPSLQGALLEDDLGDGSAGSHWDQRLFEGDIMDPVAGTRSFNGQHVISNVTLALLQDTGWYDVDFQFAAFNHWGYLAGCTFAERSSRAVRESRDTELQRFTCVKPAEADPQQLQCTVDLASRGICERDSTHDGLLHVQEQSSQHTCLRSKPVEFSESVAEYGMYRGPGSRCIRLEPGFSRIGFGIPQPSASCFKTFCQGDDDNRQLYIHMQGPGIDVPCPSGEIVDLSTISGLDYTPGSSIGPCPDNKLLCGGAGGGQGWRECGEYDCSANGDCLYGRCHCHIGFVGPACGSEICCRDSQCATGLVCHWSGECVTPEEAAARQFKDAPPVLLYPEVPIPSPPNEHLSDQQKIAIMASLAALLIVVAAVCIWVLFGKKGTRQCTLGIDRDSNERSGGGSGTSSNTPSVQMGDILGPSSYANNLSSFGSEKPTGDKP